MRFRLAVNILLCLATSASGLVFSEDKSWDPSTPVTKALSETTGGKLEIHFENRFRFEQRNGGSFGKDPDRDSTLIRNRFSMVYKPAKWLRLTGMVQDARVPGYGPNAPNSLRDSADLMKAYVEFLPDSKRGFSFAAGRNYADYGESRLIGTPQWSALARSYDQAHLMYRTKSVQLEALFLSPVKVKPDDFNTPNLGERIWGMYNAVPKFAGKNLLEFYVLRHDQNRIGGFTGGSKAAATDRLATNTFGARLAGPLPHEWKYSTEVVGQTGAIGPATQRAAAFYGMLSRQYKVGRRTLNASGEYKYASGTDNPADTLHSSTFDLLSPANHDKFGHEDLFGWRNQHDVRSLATYNLTRKFAANVMYNNIWLASARDSLYNSSGKSIARSANGSAGRHVGQELDGCVTYKVGHSLFGAGYGYFFNGGFVEKTTPGAAQTYAYLFSSYAF